MNIQQRLLALAWVCLVTFVAPEVLAGQRNISAEDTVKAQMDLLFAECKLTDDQQKTLKEKFKVKQDALEAWDKTNAEKMTAAQTAAAAARKGADADAKKKANGELKALQTEREQAAAEADKAILAVLTDDQKNQWAGVQLAQTTLAKYKKSNLTDDQTAKIKSACMIAAKDLSTFTGDDRKDKQGRATVEKCLKWAIENVILAPAPAAPGPATPAPATATQPAPGTKAPEAGK
jgi:hypothetical protein